MSLSSRSKTVRQLGLVVALGLLSNMAWGFGLFLEKPTSRCNPNDPKSKSYVSTLPQPTAVPTAALCRVPVMPSELVISNNAFALDLLASLNQTANPSANLAFSPYSVSTALAMTWAGTRWQTANQIGHVLHLQSSPSTVCSQFQALQLSLSQTAASSALDLNIANSLWMNTRYNFLTPYLELVQQGFSASLASPDFNDPSGVATLVNSWVANATRNKILNVLAPSDVDPVESAVLLVNAIYFKSQWQHDFKASDTVFLPFHLADGSLTITSTMSQRGNYYYAQDDEAQVLEMPYYGGGFSMLVILPTQNNGLASVQASLTASKLDAWIAHLCPTQVALSLPKLKLEYGTVDLKPNLSALGMADAFIPGADFSGMMSLAAGQASYIQFVKHKAVVEVNEKGTEAAAVTIVGVGVTNVVSMPIPIPAIPFKADHPFLFVIREHSTGSILFIGRVMDPNAK